MEVKLRKMTPQEYHVFYEYSSKAHANELIRERNISFDKAVHETELELKEMLPDGLNTDGQSLMVIEDASDNRFVGFIWYVFELTDGGWQVFLCDFVVQEPERRKGYASAAMHEMEKHAKAFGCEKSVLFVADENLPARALYAKRGYVLLKNADYGAVMMKKL